MTKCYGEKIIIPEKIGLMFRVTWPIKGNELMWNFFSGAQGNEIHVLHLFQVIGHHPKTSATAEVGIQESVGDLIFLGLRGEANQTHLL